MVWANLSPHSYHAAWHAELTIRLGGWTLGKTMAHWIDDALMTIFFFVVGMEIKREILVGGLSTPKKAVLPVVAAAGGMLMPAAVYTVFNYGAVTARGWGIPMATDIAFSLAILALPGRRVPFGLKIFLSAFAIADDLGAVLVIALFYTAQIRWGYLAVAGLFVLALAAANRLWIRNTLVYAGLGAGVWFFVMGSGVHATVAGVVVAMFIPARGRYDTGTFVRTVERHLDRLRGGPDCCGHTVLLNREHLNAVQAVDLACKQVETPLQRLESALHPWVSIVILPLFALANSGIDFHGIRFAEAMRHPVTLGIMAGLVIGKPAGIFGFTVIGVKVMKAPLPEGVNCRDIFGVSLLGGIGFTMSLFISGLSFADSRMVEFSRMGITIGSVICGILGLAVLYTRKTAADRHG